MSNNSEISRWIEKRPEVKAVLFRHVGVTTNEEAKKDSTLVEIVEESGYSFTELMTALINFDQNASDVYQALMLDC